jgi:SAM-dependent methyltransferase
MTDQPVPPPPLVSLVITTYNHAHFLADAIDSVMEQTVRPDEVIVVDDGSTDMPGDIVRRYPGVTYIRQENQGLAAARNTGWKAASGQFVAFLDADDKLCPKAIATNLQQFRNHPSCAFVYGAHSYMDEAGKSLRAIPLQPVGDDAFRGFLAGNLIGMHATVLYRRDRLEEVGGFDRSLPACEDYDVYLRLSRLYPVICTATCLAYYRRYGTNMSNNIPLMLTSVLRVLGNHQQAAQSRPDWAGAHRDGIAGWKNYYAGKQMGQLIGAVRSRSPVVCQLLNTARIAWIAPRSTIRAARAHLGTWRRGRKLRKRVRFGDLQRTSPISKEFGFDRGKPVDRRYIEAFLASRSSDIRGRVLEIGDNEYTRRFGGDSVTKSDVLNRYQGHPSTTFVGDLADGEDIPSDTFDCIVLTQTLHLLFELEGAVATLWRILKPGGILLVTVPWVSPIDRGEWGDSWYWSLTPAALLRLLSDRFGPGNVDITHYGNVYAATAFLYGLAEHELRAEDLDVHDPHCPVIVAGRARKGQGV